MRCTMKNFILGILGKNESKMDQISPDQPQIDSVLKETPLTEKQLNYDTSPKYHTKYRDADILFSRDLDDEQVQQDAHYLETDLNHYDGDKTYFLFFIKRLFEKQGYSVQITDSPLFSQNGKRTDNGRDLIISKSDKKIAVQIKQFRIGDSSTQKHINRVDKKRIDSLASVANKDFDQLILITTSFFTFDAVDYAKECGIELYDRKRLFELIEKYYPEVLARMAYDYSLTSLYKCPDQNCNGRLLAIHSVKNNNYYRCTETGKTFDTKTIED